MSWDVDEVEFYETFAEIAADPNRGLNGAMGWAWSALHWMQQELRERDKENRKLRSVLEWVNNQCPGKCAAVCDEALREKPSSLVEELVLLRTELLEHARLAGMGSEREARLMAQLEEARRELRGVMEALPVTMVAFTGDYGLYVRACVDALLEQERAQVARFLRQPPEKAKACDKPHRHEDGKPCLVLVPVDLDEAADLIEQGKHRIGSIDREP